LKNKPAGIVAIVVYSVFGGVLCLALGGVLMLASAMPKAPAEFGALFYFITIIGIVGLVSAYGLWTLQVWGRILTMVIYGISIPTSIYSAVTDQSQNLMILNIGGAISSIIVVVYLLRAQTLLYFRQESAIIPRNDFTAQNTSSMFCNQCGKEMKVRVKQAGNDISNKFWVCTQYPSCRNVLPITSDY